MKRIKALLNRLPYGLGHVYLEAEPEKPACVIDIWQSDLDKFILYESPPLWSLQPIGLDGVVRAPLTWEGQRPDEA